MLLSRGGPALPAAYATSLIDALRLTFTQPRA